VDRFAVLGWSAGGPHALAVAATAPQRVTRVAIAAGMPPPDGLRAMPADTRRVIRLARAWPRLAVRPLERWGRRPVAATGDPDCDRAYAAGRVESFRAGGMWLAIELALLARPWGFELGDVRAPVMLWYGTRDHVTPVSIGRYFELALPNANLRVVDDGHQLLFSRWREILESVRAAQAAGGRKTAN
jgi:pimeloyl-ACP methyl ester carboxylesterase